MLDRTFVVERADEVRDICARKRVDVDVDEIVAVETRRRDLAHRFDTRKALGNKLSKGLGPVIGMLKKAGGQLDEATRAQAEEKLSAAVEKRTYPDEYERLHEALAEGAEALQATMRALSDEVREIERERSEVEARRDELMAWLPNRILPQVPRGRSEADNVEVRRGGEPPTFDGFAAKPHWELAAPLGLHMEMGAKLAGGGFYVLTGDLARLEWALLSYFLDRAREAGYTPCMLPYLVTRATLFHTGYLPKMADQVYHTERDDLFAIPTAEAPLTSLHANEILEAEALPRHYCGFSPCWRREAGSWGADVRGLLRLHQFNKVELFKLTHPEESEAEHERLVADIEALLVELGLHYRVLELCDADLSFAAARCFDFEVYAPGGEQWLEVSSASNFLDFQTRRGGIRYRHAETGKPAYCHTLNGSGLATPRTLVALLESNQRADGSVTIPEPLRPYMSGQDHIKPQ